MKKNKLHKILSTVSLTGIFVIAAIFVFAITGIIKLGSAFVDILGILAVLDFACLFAIPWAKRLEEKTYKIPSIIFLVFIGVCAVLFIISLVLIVHTISSGKDMSAGLFTLIRVSLIIATQLLVSSTIAYTFLKYKKTMIAFQVVTYVSNLFVDFWFCCLFIGAYTTDGSINFNETISSFLFTKIMWTLLALALVYVIISNSVMKNIDKKKMQSIFDENAYTTSRAENPSINAKRKQTVDEKLTKLKFLLDRNLITQDEYDEKKKEILKDL